MLHGCSGSRPHYLYNLWAGIKKRCYNKNNKSFKNYGMRGIRMCNQWVVDFTSFKTYMEEYLGERPEGCSLDRIRNDGHYEPGNLRWASPLEQGRNTTRTYRVKSVSDVGVEEEYECLSAVEDSGFSATCVCKCIKGHRDRHKSLRWSKIL